MLAAAEVRAPAVHDGQWAGAFQGVLEVMMVLGAASGAGHQTREIAEAVSSAVNKQLQ